MKISGFRIDRLVLKFDGHDSVESAESLRDCEICVAESEAVELDEGEFFDWQLVGCRVETVDRKRFGTVIELQRTGGTENLLVSGNGKDHLIPFAESICVDVDIENKLIRIDPPEGLLNFDFGFRILDRKIKDLIRSKMRSTFNNFPRVFRAGL